MKRCICKIDYETKKTKCGKQIDEKRDVKQWREVTCLRCLEHMGYHTKLKLGLVEGNRLTHHKEPNMELLRAYWHKRDIE